MIGVHKSIDVPVSRRLHITTVMEKTVTSTDGTESCDGADPRVWVSDDVDGGVLQSSCARW